MFAYKLVTEHKDGSLSPLFINRKFRLPFGRWLKAELHPTKGFSERIGWHCTTKPHAPHLSIKGRVWVKVEVRNFTEFMRPKSQGEKWLIANEMKVIGRINE